MKFNGKFNFGVKVNRKLTYNPQGAKIDHLAGRTGLVKGSSGNGDDSGSGGGNSTENKSQTSSDSGSGDGSSDGNGSDGNGNGSGNNGDGKNSLNTSSDNASSQGNPNEGDQDESGENEDGSAPQKPLTAEEKKSMKSQLLAIDLTMDHKPDHPAERSRIEQAGGRVVFDGFYNYRVYARSGKYPGLNMSRALGDLAG